MVRKTNICLDTIKTKSNYKYHIKNDLPSHKSKYSYYWIKYHNNISDCYHRDNDLPNKISIDCAIPKFIEFTYIKFDEYYRYNGYAYYDCEGYVKYWHDAKYEFIKGICFKLLKMKIFNG